MQLGYNRAYFFVSQPFFDVTNRIKTWNFANAITVTFNVQGGSQKILSTTKESIVSIVFFLDHPVLEKVSQREKMNVMTKYLNVRF